MNVNNRWKKIAALTLAFFAGVAVTVTTLKAKPEFAARVLGTPRAPQDPFAFLAEEQKKMMANTSPDDDFFAFTGLNQEHGAEDALQQIEEREDQNFYYIDVKMSGLDGSSVQAKAQGGYVTITGEIEKQSGQGSSQSSFFHSAFSQSYPLPPNVEADKMEIMSGKDNTLTLKFPKKKRR